MARKAKKKLQPAALATLEDRKYKDVFVEEWDAEVRLRGLTVGQSTALGAKTDEDGETLKRGPFMAHYVAYSMEGEDGQPFFEEPDAGAAILLEKSFGVVTRLYTEAVKLNLGDKEAEAEALKKLKATENGASS